MSWLHRRHLQKHMLVVRSLSSFQHVDKSEDAKPGESDGKSILMKGWDGLALPNQIRPAEHLGKWRVNFARLPNTQVGVGVKFSTKLVTIVPGKKAAYKNS